MGPRTCRAGRGREMVFHGALFALLWWVLSGGAPSSWLLGAPLVAAACWLSWRLRPPRPWRFRPLAALRFLPYFCRQSLRGGVDVALRACRPSLPLAPAEVDYPLSLPEGTARIFFLNTISLLPGTLSADLRGDCLVVHVLDERLSGARQLRELEARVAALFGLEARHG